MLCAFLHLDSHITTILKILGKPHRRKVAPTKFLNDNVSLEENLANMDRMVASDFVVWHALIFTWVLVIEKWFIQFFFERGEFLLFFPFCGSRVTFCRKSRILFAVHEVVSLIEIVSVHWFWIIVDLRHSFFTFLLLILFVPLLFLLAFH